MTEHRNATHPLLVAAGLVVVIAGVKAAEQIAVPFLLAAFIATIAATPVFWLNRFRVPVGIAIALVVLLLVAVLIGVGAVVAQSAAAFQEQLPAYQETLGTRLDAVERWFAGRGIDLSAAPMDAGRAWNLAADALVGLGNMLSNGFLILLTVLFILAEASSFPRKLRAVLADADEDMPHFERFAANVNRYMAIKTSVSVATGLFVSIALSIIGVDFPILWGMLAFLLNYVPTIGSIIAAVPPVLAGDRAARPRPRDRGSRGFRGGQRRHGQRRGTPLHGPRLEPLHAGGVPLPRLLGLGARTRGDAALGAADDDGENRLRGEPVHRMDRAPARPRRTGAQEARRRLSVSYERPNIARMEGYAYGEQPQAPDAVKLNTNENPYPPSPAVAAALRDFDVADLRRYPPPTCAELREIVAAELGIDPDGVVATNGGDEALRLAITTFVDPGAAFGLATPSYSLYPVLAAVQDCAVVDVPLQADWTPPQDFADQLNAAGARLTCLVNPHAPSGALLPPATVSNIAERLDGALLVDEAYVDFVDPGLGHDLAPLTLRHDNLMLLRTLSKGYSLAGLRVGFLVGDPALVRPIRTKTRDSFNVDAIAQKLACAALADRAYAERRWHDVRRERRRLAKAFRARGFGVCSSQTNFLLVQVPEAARVFRSLREQGVHVRYFDQPRLSDCLRVTVGSPAENEALLAALGQVASGTP